MKGLPLFLVVVSSLVAGCATAPLVSNTFAFAAPVASDKAFDAAVAAGGDLGLVTLKGPAPDREKGYVGFIAGTSTGRETAKRLMPLLALGGTEYVLQVQLQTDGAVAKGADLKANRTGFGEMTKEQETAIQQLFSSYMEALKVQLAKSTK